MKEANKMPADGDSAGRKAEFVKLNIKEEAYSVNGMTESEADILEIQAESLLAEAFRLDREGRYSEAASRYQATNTIFRLIDEYCEVVR